VLHAEFQLFEKLASNKQTKHVEIKVRAFSGEKVSSIR